MLNSNKVLYKKDHLVSIGTPVDNLYYFLDYGERSYDINMEFQHFHNFHEIHILLDNHANHIIEGTLYRINLLDIVCLKPYSLHKSEYPQGPPKKRLIIQFNMPAQFSKLQDELNEVMSIFEAPLPIYRFEQKHQEILVNIINNIYQISKSNGSINTLSIHNRLIDFLCTVYNHQKNNIYEPESLTSTASKIYSIASYIHNHYYEELSLIILANKFFVSSYYLSHLFKEVTGFTLINYIQMTRIRNAQQLLLFTDRKITDIADQCGFTSFSQFNRVFNKFCHSSPRKYKAQAEDINSEINPTLYIRD